MAATLTLTDETKAELEAMHVAMATAAHTCVVEDDAEVQAAVERSFKLVNVNESVCCVVWTTMIVCALAESAEALPDVPNVVDALGATIVAAQHAVLAAATAMNEWVTAVDTPGDANAVQAALAATKVSVTAAKRVQDQLRVVALAVEAAGMTPASMTAVEYALNAAGLAVSWAIDAYIEVEHATHVEEHAALPLVAQ